MAKGSRKKCTDLDSDTDAGILAHCIGCGCNDLHACWDEQAEQPCSWVRLDMVTGRGVCSACPDLVENWDRGDREFRVPVDPRIVSQ